MVRCYCLLKMYNLGVRKATEPGHASLPSPYLRQVYSQLGTDMAVSANVSSVVFLRSASPLAQIQYNSQQLYPERSQNCSLSYVSIFLLIYCKHGFIPEKSAEGDVALCWMDRYENVSVITKIRRLLDEPFKGAVIRMMKWSTNSIDLNLSVSATLKRYSQCLQYSR